MTPGTTGVASAQIIPPSALMATATSSSEVTLEWNASTDSGGRGIGEYQVFRNGTWVGTTLVTQYVDTGLLPNTQYCYTVVALDLNGNSSSPSAEACITTQPVASPAAYYYVDYAGGSDANPGTSPETAWQHCPGDLFATGVAGSTALNPGDTVIFKGGVQYMLENIGIELDWSGTPEQPITYDGNSAGTWGDGNAILLSTNHLCIGFSTMLSENIAFTQSIFTGPVGKANVYGNGYNLEIPSIVSNGPAATETYIEQTNPDGSANLYNGNPWYMGSSNGLSLAYESITNSLGTNMYVIEDGSLPSPTNTVLFYTQSE